MDYLIPLPFFRQELIMLRRHLTYRLMRLRAELEEIIPDRRLLQPSQRFQRSELYLLHWTLCARDEELVHQLLIAVNRVIENQATKIDLSALLPDQAVDLVDLLQFEQNRERLARSYLQNTPLDAQSKEILLAGWEIERRFYDYLIIYINDMKLIPPGAVPTRTALEEGHVELTPPSPFYPNYDLPPDMALPLPAKEDEVIL